MMKFIGALLLLTALAVPGYSKQQRPRQRVNAGLQDVVLGFYISQFQQVSEVNDETFAKILPFLRQFVEDRFEISARRTRSLNQLRQLTNRGGADEDIKRMVRELDKADADGLANQERFLASVDPLLNTRQQAKVRIFQAMSDQRIRQMLDRIQNAGPNQQQAVPGARK